MKKLVPLKGDASIRKFYRKKNNLNTSIVVFAKKENYIMNYIEIQDFGNETFFRKLNKKKDIRFIHFKKIVNLLNKIQSIKNRKIKNFKNKDYIIPKYDKKILINEASLFCDWYLKKNPPKLTKDKFSKEFKKIIKRLTLNLKLKNSFFVHRDFHVSNLMMVNNRIGLIDSQDALIGNRAYDLASLIDDVRLKTPKSLKKKIFNFYIKRQKNLDVNKFKNDFEILSILRNLKIIGIFTRLALRDGKKNYLKMIPYSWQLINMRISENEVFQDLKELLNQNFKSKLNEN